MFSLMQIPGSSESLLLGTILTTVCTTASAVPFSVCGFSGILGLIKTFTLVPWVAGAV